MGKPIAEAAAEVDKCALSCDFYAAQAEGFLADEPVQTDAPELFRTLLVADASVTEATGRLLADPWIAAVTLTGSERAGAAVGASAGRALKKCVLELGGSDPFLVLADADLEVAAEAAARARFLNGGQSCIAAKRLVVEEPVAVEFERDMPVFREETFGPVAAVVRAPDERAAVELANDTPYGLGASVWTRDLERAQRLGRRIESGSLFVNSVVASDPRLPFGGVKRSGYGRELAVVGIREFTNIRTFWVQPADAPQPATLAE
jgi:acyl-CoA reductase-like NAD-dependent aldehyde dehydrogenase